MIRFLFGLILGGAVSAVALGAAAVMNPLPDGPVSRMKPMTDEVAVPAPAPESATAVAPEPAPMTGEVETASAAPEAPVPDAPAPATLSAPVAPATETSGFSGSTAPEAASGPAMGAPAIGGASAGGGVNVRTDTTPIRTASAPQVALSGGDSAGAPSVNTESAGVPEVGNVGGDIPDAVANAALVPGSALISNGATFNGDLSKPLMGIILIDEGGDAGLRSGLTALSAPITFGVTADLSDSRDVASLYGNSGFEVVAVMPGSGPLGLNADTTPDEVPALLASAISAVPNATAIVDSSNNSVPANSELTEMTLEALRVTGHGLLTYQASGGNTVPQMADEKGVYSDVIYRVIDREPGAASIALALEQAVQDARTSGGVIVVGHVRQQTVTSLFQWLLGADPRDVTIAPISVVLR